MPDTSRIHQLRLHIDRLDDAHAHAVRSGEITTGRWASAVEDARATLAADPADTTHLCERSLAAEVLRQHTNLIEGTAPGFESSRPLRFSTGHGDLVGVLGDGARTVGSLFPMVRAELRHILTGRPHSVLIRLGITIAMALGFVVAYQIFGWSSYDAKSLTIYIFSALVGSVVCTNALCFDAQRVRSALAESQPLWRVLVVKNISIAALIGVAAVPVVLALSARSDDPNTLVVIDQLVAMLFIWLGVANVLSVIAPLRHEPFAERLTDGTWVAFLLSFGISYGVGLTVNLMIYWRMWARHAAADEVTGGGFSALALVFVSSMLTWVLLTVLAVTAATHPVVRRVLDREMTSQRRADSTR